MSSSIAARKQALLNSQGSISERKDASVRSDNEPSTSGTVNNLKNTPNIRVSTLIPNGNRVSSSIGSLVNAPAIQSQNNPSFRPKVNQKSSQRLIHLTASRVKPQPKRPPSLRKRVLNSSKTDSNVSSKFPTNPIDLHASLSSSNSSISSNDGVSLDSFESSISFKDSEEEFTTSLHSEQLASNDSLPNTVPNSAAPIMNSFEMEDRKLTFSQFDATNQMDCNRIQENVCSNSVSFERKLETSSCEPKSEKAMSYWPFISFGFIMLLFQYVYGLFRRKPS